MYSIHKNVQILVSLLKQYGIRNIVISAGSRLIPLAFSVENDPYFTYYSVVDERSAAFFGLGLVERLQEPVAILCTSGTATCNYVSAVAEAYYQHLPLLVLTSDRNRYYLNQQEDQCVPQTNLFGGFIRKSVDLPIVRDEMEAWYCGRLINEALLELNHKESGPVHINFQIDDSYPIEKALYDFNTTSLPTVTKINRITATDPDDAWQKIASELSGKRVMILWGQHLPLSDEDTDKIDKFCKNTGAVLISDNIGNIHISNRTNGVFLTQMPQNKLAELYPDILITMNGNRLQNIRNIFRNAPNTMQHWHVSADGLVSDPLKRQNLIVECDPIYFFNRLSEKSKLTGSKYAAEWANAMGETFDKEAVLIHDFKFSSVAAIQSLINNMPKGSLFHVSNSNSIRIVNHFPIDKSISIYCNRGTCGIDGSMSSFIAQSYISKKPSFLVIGDLSFFYDMNALWNRYTANARIMLINNACGALFHSSYYKPFNGKHDVDNVIAAGHTTSAKGWAENQGFRYLQVKSNEDIKSSIKEFTDPDAATPVLMEVYTRSNDDTEQMTAMINCLYKSYDKPLSKLKGAVTTPLKKMINKIKN